MEEDERILDELWIDKLARITGMDKLSNKIFNNKKFGPYLFIWIVFLCAHISWQFPHYFKQGHTTIIDYFTVLFVGGITFGVWAIHKIDKKYNMILKNLTFDKRVKLKNLHIFHNKLIFLIIALSLYLSWEYLYFYEVVNRIGIIPMVINLIFMLFFSMPVIAEFVTYFFNIHVIFPFQLKKLEPDIDFSDPFKRAGMERIGNLYLFTSELYFVGLIIYNSEYIIYHLTGIGFGMGDFMISIYLGGWILGIIFFFVPQLWIHRYMKQRKEEKIQEIYEEMEKDIGNDEEKFPDVFPDDPDEMVQYMHNYLKLDMAHSQSEYPFDMAKIRELFAIAIIPLALELSKMVFL